LGGIAKLNPYHTPVGTVLDKKTIFSDSDTCSQKAVDYFADGELAFLEPDEKGSVNFGALHYSDALPDLIFVREFKAVIRLA
jgi:hypothetical protein